MNAYTTESGKTVSAARMETIADRLAADEDYELVMYEELFSRMSREDAEEVINEAARRRGLEVG